MAEATLTTYVETGNPNEEVVVLECTDGETYTPRKFKVPATAFAAWGEDTDGYINCTINSTTGVVTVNAAGANDSVIFLTLKGGSQ